MTTIDFPGRLAAVLFCQGCSWRCQYCHNHHLQSFEMGSLSWDEALGFLKRRQGLLDGVVFSGGEPLHQEYLGQAMEQVKALGFEIGLHTAGILPRRLEKVLPKVDWIGLDIKHLADSYSEITGIPHSGELAWESLNLILVSGVDFEVRTTSSWSLHNPQQILDLAQELSNLGVQNFAVQKMRDLKTNLPVDQLIPQEEERKLWERIGKFFPKFYIR